MCGLAGVFSLRSHDLPDGARNAIDVVLRALEHRGPDGSGAVERPGVILGHRRLSILDLEGGAQPLQSAGSQGVIVYNGELYGFTALRDELNRAAPLRTRSDTEVLLRHFEAAGPDGLRRMNGMYAFAVHDAINDQLTLGRDAAGIKPLYLAQREHWVAFASELASLATLLEQLGERVTLDREALATYLQTGWIAAPATLLAGVTKLLPGEVLRFHRDGRVERFETPLPAPQPRPAPRSVTALAQQTLDVIREAVRDQLVADVPVGLFLSGGIDSSLLLALASEQTRGIATFSLGFRDLAEDRAVYDESQVASEVAAHFGAQHHELQLRADAVFGHIDAIADSIDEPIADPATIPLFFLAQFASRYLKVCLTGDGGDELFGGYQHHRVRGMKALLHGSDSGASTVLQGVLKCARRLVPRSFPGGRRAGAAIDLLLQPGITPPLFFAAPGSEQPLWSDPDALLLAEMRGPLANGMLQKTDRVTMYHSLEARVPLLDDRVISYARGLAWDCKVRRGHTKYALRAALATYLPERLWARSKRGFRVPLDQWLRADLAPWVRERLRALDAIRGELQGIHAEQLLEEHETGSANHGARLWALAVLAPWIERADGRVS
jgi:asparagine synthase (glutamine-hydrolysing)